MHLLVMFDLPTETKEEKKAYASFRKMLVSNGFYMLQYSVYVRFCVDRDYAYKFQKIVEKNVPAKGSIRSIAVTNKQFTEMPVILGTTKAEEKVQNYEQLTIF